MTEYRKIDLHMHSTVSDGTDTPSEILSRVKEAGIDLFALSDHDAFKGCDMIHRIRKPEDPHFICAAEFSCRDEKGKYHILGYGFDTKNAAIRKVIDLGHSYRMNKVQARLDFLQDTFGFVFKDEDIKSLLALDNPGKPHIGNLMVRYGYAKTKEEAITQYINKAHFHQQYVRPEEAIAGILGAGGIPVLAHPSYGSGEEIIVGEEMEERLQYLIAYGLQGVEAYYSGFTARLRDENLNFAQKYDLYVTAGSDYHGTNKLVVLGDNGLDDTADGAEGLQRFLHDIADRIL